MTVAELHWTTQSGYPILTALQLLPLLGSLMIFLLRDRSGFYPAAIGVAMAELLLSVDLYRRFNPGETAMQLAEQLTLFPLPGYHAAVDGMSVLFVLLTAVLSALLVLYARVLRLARLPRLLSVVLAIEALLQAMFVTRNLLWFTLLSAAELLLIAWVMQRWAKGPQDNLSMARYLQFMGVGLLLLFAGVFMLGWNHAVATGGQWSFDLNDLALVPVPAATQSVIFFLLFYGLGIRIPLFPLHGWLPPVAEHGTIAIAGIFLVGLKTGLYGLVRFVLPLLHGAVLRWHEWVVAFALAGIFYAAILALLQVNLRRMLAFAVISHTGVIIIGLFSLGHAAFQASILLAASFGTATACLLLMSGFVYRRTRTLLLPRLGGLFGHLPVIGTAFMIGGLSIIGMPGTPGFYAVHLMLEAAILEFGAMLTIAAALGNLVAAAFLLWAFQRAFLAPLAEDIPAPAIDPPVLMERVIAVILVMILLGTGFHSEPWLELIEHSFDGLTALYDGNPAQVTN